MQPEKIIDKLRKLMRHEQSAREIGSEAEADAFAIRIQSLLEQHKIELSEIALDEATAEPVIERVLNFDRSGEADLDGIYFHKNKRNTWLRILSLAVAEAHFCKTGSRRGSASVIFVGKKTDIEVATYVFLVLAQTGTRLARAAKASLPLTDRHFTSSFLEGFADRITERYWQRANDIKAQRTEGSQALILSTNTQIKKYMEGEGWRKARPTRGHSDRFGHNLGRRAAESVNIDPKGMKSGAPKQLK